jgi:hypothetical protein
MYIDRGVVNTGDVLYVVCIEICFSRRSSLHFYDYTVEKKTKKKRKNVDLFIKKNTIIIIEL